MCAQACVIARSPVLQFIDRVRCLFTFSFNEAMAFRAAGHKLYGERWR